MENNNKRIAKNTIFLYCRTALTMLISLYTSRVVLQVLGVSDYGIYGVVASLVSTFSIVSSNMNVASNRFLAYELGRNKEQVKSIFSSLLTIHLAVSLALLLIIEIVGTWYVFNMLNVPAGRTNAAFWAFQFSTLSFFLNLSTIPYNSSLIAFEKMDFFAFIGIAEALIKLAIVFAISYAVDVDKLILYSGLYFLSLLIVKCSCMMYCYKKIPNTRTLFSYRKDHILKLGKFLGWNGIGSLSVILREQGISLLSNFYFGTIINAARSLTTQIQQALSSFSGNFIVALNPQITKLCAARKYEEMNKLVDRGSRLSYFLMLFFSLPILINIPLILKLWLGEFPDYTISFVRLSLTFFTIKSLQAPLTIAILASGQVKKYNICYGVLNLLIFPISWLAFYMGCSPEASYIVCIIVTTMILLFMAKIYIDIFHFPIAAYIKNILLKCLFITALSFSVPILLKCMLVENYITMLLNIFVSLISIVVWVMWLGVTDTERIKIMSLVKNKILKIKVK